MARAVVVLTGIGKARSRQVALAELGKLGEVHESSLTVEHINKVTIEGKDYEVPATRYTAEVTPDA